MTPTERRDENERRTETRRDLGFPNPNPEMPHVSDDDERCFTCQVDEAVKAHTATQQERNHWSLWGCTCSPESAAEAEAWVRLVTD